MQPGDAARFTQFGDEVWDKLQRGMVKNRAVDESAARVLQDVVDDLKGKGIVDEVAPLDMAGLEARLKELDDAQTALYVNNKVPKANKAQFSALADERDAVLDQLNETRQAAGWTDEEMLFGKGTPTDVSNVNPRSTVDVSGDVTGRPQNRGAIPESVSPASAEGNTTAAAPPLEAELPPVSIVHHAITVHASEIA